MKPKPVINSFTSTSSTINEGESTTLSWDISGADSASIDNGIGGIDAVSGTRVVSPGSTTTYTLTATNIAGSVTASVTITVRPILHEGWNLMSLDEQPVDTSITSVLGMIEGKYNSVWAFIDNSWKVYDPANPGFSELNTMESGIGYWIDMKESAKLVVSGWATYDSVNLVSGWNLVGYNSSDSKGIAEAVSSIEGKLVSIYAFKDGQWKVYDPSSPGISDLSTMEPGYGYWINVSEDCTWTLPGH